LRTARKGIPQPTPNTGSGVTRARGGQTLRSVLEFAASHAIPPAFLERARREAERYGDDPWILLRELVQNSRDAGASEIEFSLARDGERVALSCTDDGSGMSRVDMREYLLRLYASGKAPAKGESADDRAAGPVGRFGVGFWSVLRFAPDVVRVESRRDGEGTAFEVDCVANALREVPCSLSRNGTRVTLVRPDDDEQLAVTLRSKIRYWAGPVTGARGGRPPRLSLDGMPLNEGLEAPELIGARVKGRGFDGLVGLDKRPSVRLYSHGLLIRDVGSLEELLPRRTQARSMGAPGLYPVVRINADGLEVLMNRQAVVEDALLLDVVRTCESKLLDLRHRLLDRLAPLRVLDRLRVAWPTLSWVAGLYLVVVSAGAFAVAQLPDDSKPTRRVEVAPQPYTAPTPRALPARHDDVPGPRINSPRSLLGDHTPWDVSVSGPGVHLVKVLTHARFDEERGLIADRPSPVGWYPYYRMRGEGLSIEAAVDATGRWTPLPIPAGWVVVNGKVVADDVRPIRVRVGKHGEPLIDGSGVRRVAYRVQPRTEPLKKAPAVGEWGATPSFLPSVSDVASFEPAERAGFISVWTQRRVTYSTSPDDARRLAAASGPFMERVWQVQRGDCDVMNAFAAIALRSWGVPARLAVGLVVDDGVVANDLHAWTEYFDGERWRALDVSPPLEVEGADINVPSSADFYATQPEPVALRGIGSAPSTAPYAAAPLPPAAAPPTTAWGVDLDLPSLKLSGEQRRWTGFALGSGALAALLAILALWLTRPRGQRLDEETLLRLLDHFLQSPHGADPLHLRHRPFFPTLGGRRLALADLERLAGNGGLFAAHPGERLLRYLERGALVLDRADRKLDALLPRLPQVTPLADLAAIVRSPPDALLADLEAQLRALDDGVRVHLDPERDDVREVSLPVKAGGLAPRHILVGGRAPQLQALRELHAERPSLAVFRLLGDVIDRTTLYRAQRDTLLSRAARGVVG
jgi:hypothetical protein